jgi:hypothetical protein
VRLDRRFLDDQQLGDLMVGEALGGANVRRLKALAGVLTSVAFAYVLGGVVIALQLDLAGYLVQTACR